MAFEARIGLAGKSSRGRWAAPAHRSSHNRRPLLSEKGCTNMRNKPLDADLIAQLTFDYYKQQREEFMSLSKERSSLSLQFLVLLGALSLVFNQASSEILKLGVAAVLLFLGSLGLVINVSIERELQMYVVRARAARKSLRFIEEFAAAQPLDYPSRRAIRQDKMYLAFMLLIIVVGLVFALIVLLS